MGDYIDSLDLLLARGDRRYYPTHGSPIEDPHDYVGKLRAHRLARAEQVLDSLGQDAASPQHIARQLYTHLPEAMLGAAARAVLATLIYLREQGHAVADGDDVETARWRIVEQ